MILFCKAIEFAVEDRLFLEKYVPKSAKSQENLPKMVRKNAEKSQKSGKSQEKNQAEWQPCSTIFNCSSIQIKCSLLI